MLDATTIKSNLIRDFTAVTHSVELAIFCDTRVRSNSKNSHIVLLNMPTTGMPMYAHPKTASSLGGSGSLPNTWLFGSTRAHMPNGISIGTNHGHVARTQFSNPQNCPFAGGGWEEGSGPPSNTWLLWPMAHSSPHAKQHVDRFSCFCRKHPRDGQTDQPRHTSVATGRIYMPCIYEAT